MNRTQNKGAGFSLVEIVVALGVAAFCLIAVLGMLPVGLKTQQTAIQQTQANAIITQILGDLRADVRLPPGQQAKSQESTAGLGLHGHWAAVATPDTLYFTNAGNLTGSVNAGTVPADAVFRAKITYLLPPTSTTSLAHIKVTWPAPVDPAAGVPSGSVETFIAVNR